MTEQFVFGIQSLPNHLEKLREQFEVKARYNNCSQPIRLKVKSYKVIENGLDIEFYTKEDAELFYDNLDKEIELIFNSPE